MAGLRVNWEQGRVLTQPPTRYLTPLHMVFIPIFLTFISLFTVSFIVTLINLSWVHSQLMELWVGICALLYFTKQVYCGPPLF